ncbi:hypothetical protein HMSSN036_23770 [Paenibacillus macerans]|nr:hypothetical protein HMSSN036_23770 [Paenibacillus macerans]
MKEEYIKTKSTKLQLIQEVLQILTKKDNVKKKTYLIEKKVIFGTGEASKKIMLKLLAFGESVESFIDNNSSKWGVLNGIPVKGPQHLCEFNKNHTIIMVASVYYDEISKQLLEAGFIENIDFINANDITNYLENV